MIVFEDIIVDMFSNKKVYAIVTELFIRGGKQNISLFLITVLFCCCKKYWLNSMHHFVMKMPNKSELHQIAFNHSSYIDFQDFMNLYNKCTAKPNSFLVINTVLASDNSSYFRKSFRKNIKVNHDKMMKK